MDNFIILILIGLIIGTFGTLIGAGGGFILVPILILNEPQFSPDTITAISIAVVAVNAISGSTAYAISGRIDYKAGWLFGLFTIPGSVLGVLLVKYIPQKSFDIIFGIILLMLSAYLFSGRKNHASKTWKPGGAHLRSHQVTDKKGEVFTYQYNQMYGIIISFIVGFLSPILGIGGGIIHVPAMVQLLQFPIYIATATSHFILAIMSTISVLVHVIRGTYNDPHVLKMVVGLCIGVVPGAQLGAYISHRIKTKLIIIFLAACLAAVAVRILISAF